MIWYFPTSVMLRSVIPTLDASCECECVYIAPSAHGQPQTAQTDNGAARPEGRTTPRVPPPQRARFGERLHAWAGDRRRHRAGAAHADHRAGARVDAARSDDLTGGTATAVRARIAVIIIAH